MRARVALLVVEAAEQLRARQREPHLLERLALGRLRGRSASPGSTRPPGNAMWPDHGSPSVRARSMNSTSAPDFPSASTIATAARRSSVRGQHERRAAGERAADLVDGDHAAKHSREPAAATFAPRWIRPLAPSPPRAAARARAPRSESGGAGARRAADLGAGGGGLRGAARGARPDPRARPASRGADSGAAARGALLHDQGDRARRRRMGARVRDARAERRGARSRRVARQRGRRRHRERMAPGVRAHLARGARAHARSARRRAAGARAARADRRRAEARRRGGLVAARELADARRSVPLLGARRRRRPRRRHRATCARCSRAPTGAISD